MQLRGRWRSEWLRGNAHQPPAAQYAGKDEERRRPAEGLYSCFINMLINGWMDGWWTARRTDDKFKIQSQLVSIEHEIGTWWRIITRHTRLLPPSAQIFGLLPSLFCSLLRLFSLGDNYLNAQSVSSLPLQVSHFFSRPLSVINSLSSSPPRPLSSPPSTSQLSLCSALVLPVFWSDLRAWSLPDPTRGEKVEGERQMKK